MSTVTTPLLRHHSDLLRERRAPHRPCLHDHHCRCRRKVEPAPWSLTLHFLTGTDEHELKVQRAAEENNCSPIEWADQTVVRFQDAWRQLGISNDDFIRTSEQRHYSAVEKLLQACYDNGDVDLQTYEGLYCVSCEAYFGEGDLNNGNCPIHGRPVEHVTEENHF